MKGQAMEYTYFLPSEPIQSIYGRIPDLVKQGQPDQSWGLPFFRGGEKELGKTWEKARGAFKGLFRYFRKKGYELEYIAVFKVSKYHPISIDVLVRGDYVRWKQLSGVWRMLSGAEGAYSVELDGASDTINFVAGYMADAFWYHAREVKSPRLVSVSQGWLLRGTGAREVAIND
jgi:hypothetical protein